jgi:uncharacterized protein (TIGR03435 family)
MTLMIEGKTLSQRAGTCGIREGREGNHVICHAAGMEQIVTGLRGLLRAPVVDRTGLTGSYDFHLVYLPEGRRLDANAPASPTVEQAVREELGLRLEQGKAAVEVIIVDRIEKPSGN